ncbi:tetratricopeptide repeat protein [Arcicella aquatica]|uniref:Tetratricopeptide repeat protein n=1 Tax=Arcicella aquatica TaxID=217141 RepID=A0ABU5QM32_9BACT|nr:tetratricopeptide repeat protein [Arcicella aquatica]MEA5258132.1 tetratricopeptide repeat protein [Arcicella aquatica]
MNFIQYYSSRRFIKGFFVICLLVNNLSNLCSQTFKEEDKENLGLYFHNPDTTFRLLKEKYNKANEQKDFVQAGLYLQQMGQICYHFGHYPQALDFHLQASTIFKANQKKELLAGNLNDLGVLYYYNHQRNLARQYYDEALGIYKNTKNELGMANTLGKIGQLYEKQQKYDSAFVYQRRAMMHYQKINNRQGMSKIYENIGSIYEDLAKYDSAYFYYQRSFTLNKETNNQIAQIEVLNNLGDVFRKTDKVKESLQYSKKALAMALDTKENYQLSGAYRDIAKAYNLLGRNDSAYHYLELSRKTALDIYDENSNKQLALLQVMYDISKKNNEIQQLNNAKKQNQIIGFAIGIVTILLAALATVIISRQRLKIKSERFLNEERNHVYETQKELMEVALRNKVLEEENLKNLLEVKTKELSSHTLHVIQKNQLLEKLYNKLEEMIKDERRDPKRQLRQIMQEINQSFNHDQYWDEFRGIFEQVHQSFFDKLKATTDNLTANDLRLVALLKMNLNSADISSLLGISQDSLRVVRYRLRKKLNLAQGDSLSAFIQAL